MMAKMTVRATPLELIAFRRPYSARSASVGFTDAARRAGRKLAAIDASPSNTATEAVVRAPPDGYTLLQISSVNAYNATLYDKLNFDFIRDIMPVAGITLSFGHGGKHRFRHPGD